MNTLLSNRRKAPAVRWLSAAALATTLLLAGCGPSDVGKAKLKKVSEGAKREAVLAAMGTGPLAPVKPADQPRIVNGFRRQMYLVNGTMYEVLWYRDEPGTLEDPIVRERETPVVVEGDTLVGWGWKFYSPFAAKINLPDPTHDQARADSIIAKSRADSARNAQGIAK